jgi:hypothetical protein
MEVVRYGENDGGIHNQDCGSLAWLNQQSRVSDAGSRTTNRRL